MSGPPGNHVEEQATPRRSHRRRKIIVLVLVGALLALTIPTVVAYFKLNGNITRLDVSRYLGNRPSTSQAAAGQDKPLNILVMGSDTREGIGTTEYGKDTIEGGAHSDTNLLVHISGDRERALVVSIPRDSMTMAPKDCADPNSTVANGAVRQWNYNYNQGGPGCVIKTLEGLTGVYVDHFVVVDFRGFQDMVDALGGVEVCTTTDIADADAHFTLAAGRHRLDGKQALGYVRVRKTVNDGSDLNRIKRQQAFLSSIVQEATSTGLLLRPDRLYGFLNAATKSMTTDPDLGATTLASIANSLRHIGVGNIEFVTVPTEVYPEDENRVQWTDEATVIWEAIKADRPLETAPATPKPTSTTPAKPLTVSPDQISVQISNDSGVEGLALQAGNALAVQGFVIAGYANGAVEDVTGVRVVHSPATADAARTVAAAFPGAKLVEDAGADATITVHLGTGAPNPVAVPNRLGTDPLPSMTISAAPATSGGLETRKADQDICN